MKKLRKVFIAIIVTLIVAILTAIFNEQIKYGLAKIHAALGKHEDLDLLKVGIGMAILFLHMVVDFITGLINAIFFKSSKKTELGGLSSKIGTRGLMKKTSVLLLVFLLHMTSIPLFFSMVAAFSTMELLSIVENLALMGVPIPKKLLVVLEVMRDKEKKKEEEKEDVNDGH